jgi:enoyl-CoA hydratase/carnithine racemase
MTGRWMDAVEAKHWGLANHIVPKGQAMGKAREIARQLADGPPLLYPAIKQLLRHSEMLGEHDAFELHDSLHAVQKRDAQPGESLMTNVPGVVFAHADLRGV